MLLIVDDDLAVRTSLRLLLKQAGYVAEAVPGPVPDGDTASCG